MIKYICKGHPYEHEVQTGIQIFFPNRHYYVCEKIENEGICIVSIFNEKR